jgi:hypothetical protein
MLAGTGMADNNPVGTWEGLDAVGDTINVVLYDDGTIEGTWEEDLSPDCIIYWDISTTYNFDPETGHLIFCFDDRKPCIGGYELRVDVCVDGNMTACDYTSGTSYGTGYIYYQGSLVEQVTLDTLTWYVERVSTPLKATIPSPAAETVSQ